MTFSIVKQALTKLIKMTLSMVTRSKTVQEVLLGAVMLIVAMLSVVMLNFLAFKLAIFLNSWMFSHQGPVL
jgi:hypothetical protein